MISLLMKNLKFCNSNAFYRISALLWDDDQSSRFKCQGKSIEEIQTELGNRATTIRKLRKTLEQLREKVEKAYHDVLHQVTNRNAIVISISECIQYSTCTCPEHKTNNKTLATMMIDYGVVIGIAHH